MLGVSCSPFSIATLFITPFSALGIWHAVHPGKCQQYGICYTYWSWYTVENNGPNFKRHGAKNRACCNMQTVNPPWMSCLKTKRAVFFITFVAWFVSWCYCKLKKHFGQMRTGWIFPCLVLVPWYPCSGAGDRVGKSVCGQGGAVGPACDVSQGGDRQRQRYVLLTLSTGRGMEMGDVLMNSQESLEGHISSPLSSVSTL